MSLPRIVEEPRGPRPLATTQGMLDRAPYLQMKNILECKRCQKDFKVKKLKMLTVYE